MLAGALGNPQLDTSKGGYIEVLRLQIASGITLQF